MVALDDVRAGNARAAESLPAGLVGVFGGSTSGIGELAIKSVAKHAVKPRLYIVGRSQEAGERIQGELKELNPGGEYIFMSAELSLMKNVDELCAEIKAKEQVINILFLSQGTLRFSGTTSEGLRYLPAVSYFSRMRMIVNLLPLIQAAPSLRRVVTTMSAGFEGKFYSDHAVDFNVPLSDTRPHTTTQITLAMEGLAQRYPTVSFIHNFPGSVKTNLIRSDDGFVLQLVKVFFSLRMRKEYWSNEEVGERHAWLCLSGLYPPREGDAKGAPPMDGLSVVKGADGVEGSGFYSISGKSDSTGQHVVTVLDEYREKGAVAVIQQSYEAEFKRITGTTAI